MTRTDALRQSICKLLEDYRPFLDTHDVQTLRLDLRIKHGRVAEAQFMPTCAVSYRDLSGYDFHSS